MATVSRESRRRVRRKYIDGEGNEFEVPRRSGGRKLLVVAILGVGLLWMAPTIVAKTRLLGLVVNADTFNVDGTVEIRSASLGWFSPIRLWDVEVRDPEGGLFVRVPKVVGERSLLKILFNRSDWGNLRFEEPTMRLVVDAKGSNAERVMAPWLNSDEASTLDATAVNLKISDAQATVLDEVRNQSWRLEDVQFSADVPPHLSQDVKVTMAANVDAPTERGRIEMTADVRWNEIDHAEPASSGKVSLVAKGLPLEMASWIAERVSPGTEVAGIASSTLHCEWTPQGVGGQPTTKIEGNVHADDLVVAGPWLGNDRLQLASLEVPCRISQEGSQVQVSQLDMNCDVGQVNYQGTIDTADGLLASLGSEDYKLDGKLDLARLSQMLPETLRVREGTKITQGDVTIQLVSAQKSETGKWTGRIETSPLTAVSDGKQITWDDPLLVKFDARQGDKGLLVDELRCESSFLELEAAGEPNYFSVAANYNLEKLSDELRQFFDLRDVKLSGDGWSYVNWQRNGDGTFEVDGETQVRELVVEFPGHLPLKEANLIALVNSTGRAKSINEFTQLATASIKADSGLDHLAVKLTGPVDDPRNAEQWPLAVEAWGQLTNWVPRIEPVVGSLEGWNVSGQGKVQATAVLASDRVQVASSDLAVNNLHLNAHGVVIDEPQLTASAAGDANRDGEIHLNGLTLNSATLSLNSKNLVAVVGEEGISQLSGDLAYRGDLRLLQNWLSDPASPSSWNTGGTVNGTVNIQRSGSTTDVVWASHIVNLVAHQVGGDLWHQQNVQCTGKCALDETADRLAIDSLTLACDALTCNANGSIDQLGGPRNMTLKGNVDYDMAKVAVLLRPYVGDHVQLVGKEKQSFSLSGPLTTPENSPPGTLESTLVGRLEGATTVGWDSGNLYGFQLGKGNMNAQLGRGRLAVSALDLPLSGGRLNANPLFVLAPGTAEMYLDPGPLLTRVNISPEMCRNSLMYIAPVFANVAQAQGSFSIDISGCRVPLATPAQGDLAGQFTIHDVQITGGPLIQELGVLLQRPSAASLARESKVSFRMVGGRIYHRDLELVFPELTIRTYGSVGLDHSLALMAEMPVPPKWIGNNTLGAALQNQIIQLPIGGTLEQPKINQQALQQASAQFIRNTASSAIRNELNNQLDRLLRGNQ